MLYMGLPYFLKRQKLNLSRQHLRQVQDLSSEDVLLLYDGCWPITVKPSKDVVGRLDSIDFAINL